MIHIVAPEQDSDGFNFQAWEALGYGVPTLVYNKSGIAAVLEVDYLHGLGITTNSGKFVE